MNLWIGWLGLPVPLRLVLLALAGLVVGGQINRGIYTLAWKPRWISPWSSAPIGHSRRRAIERIPMFGWILLRREGTVHGRGFWIRPLLIELGVAAVFAGLYWWEVVQLELIPRLPGMPPADLLQPIVHAQLLAHLVLFSLLMVATFIDFDEKTIPDEVTVSGTLFALLYIGAFPWALLPTTSFVPGGFQLHPLWAGGPPWPGWFGTLHGWASVLALFALWCFALADKTVTLRRGWSRGLSYLLVSVYRRRSWYLLLPIFLLGAAYLTAIWWLSPLRWESVSSSILGLACGGAIIWGVRVVGRAALGIEAMGFGDVTLMSMIGAFLGWQASVMVFFLAPIAALFIALAQWLMTGTHYIAFGPYLSLAAMATIVGWRSLWFDWLQPIFELGPLVLAAMVVCLALMGLMLWAWRLFRERVLNLKYS